MDAIDTEIEPDAPAEDLVETIEDLTANDDGIHQRTSSLR